jgi:hypothetical protein
MKIKIGQNFESKQGDSFTVISKCREIYGNKLETIYYVKFNHENTPKNFLVRTIGSSILKGIVENPYYPSFHGVAFKGDTKTSCIRSQAGKVWCQMIERCFNMKVKEKNPTYRESLCCSEWLNFSLFEQWYNSKNVPEGYKISLDKDAKIKGNKTYSPETCCLVPRYFNSLFTKSDASRGRFMIGVSYHKRLNKFKSSVSYLNKSKHLGYFNTEREAFLVYKFEKEKIIKEEADKIFKLGFISKSEYEQILTYEVNEYD